MIYAVVLLIILLMAKWMRTYQTSSQGMLIRGAKKDFFYFATGILLLIIALRGIDVGADTRVYQYLFNHVRDMSFNQIGTFYKDELGFYFLTSIIGKIFNNYQFFLLVTGGLFLIPVAYLIYIESENVLMSYFLFLTLGFYTLSFSNIKEILALGICILAYRCSNRKLLAVILVLVAGTFHFSALIFIPAIFLDKIRITKIRLVIMAIAPIAIIASFNSIVNLINYVVAVRNGKAYDVVAVSGFGMMIFLIMNISLGIYIYYCNANLREDQGFVRLIYIMYISFIIFVATRFNLAAMRAYHYYFIFSIIFIPKILNRIKNNGNRKIITFLFVMIALYYMIFKVFDDPYADSRRLLPYYFFWKDI